MPMPSPFPDPPAGRIRRLAALSLQGRLALLVVTTVLPLIALSLVQAYLSYETERESFADRAAHLARAIAQAVDADHQVRIAGLQALAVGRAVRAGDMEAFRATAAEFIAQQPPGSTLGIADRTGQLLLAVGDVPAGMALPKRANMAAQAQVFETGAPVVSNLFRNAITGKHTYTVEVPVLRDGQVVYVLALDPTPAHLAEVIRQQRVQPGWTATIIDPQGIVVAREPNMAQFIGRMSGLRRQPAAFEQAEGFTEINSLEGIPNLTAFSRSAHFGWRVNVGVQRKMIYGPLRQKIYTIIGVAALVLLASLAMAAGVARGITRPIGRLARFATASTQRGQPLVSPEWTGFSEVDEVGRVLVASTTALRTLADSLEHRIETELAERLKAEETLRQSQKMEIVGQLTTGIAHDFNNLLQAQMTWLEMLLTAVRGQERPTRFAEKALESSEKGARLTHSLLSFSRKQMLRPEAVDTTAAFDQLQDLLSRTLDPRIALRIEVESGLAAPLADSTQLEAALLNLCLNARDAMAGRGGQLLVEAYSEVASAPGALSPGGSAAAHWVVFAVTDEGTGMDPATLARVCEPFFTTKGVGQGSGLGLSMVQGFARQSGGELLIESTPGLGTCARIWLPQAMAGRAATHHGTEASHPHRPGPSPCWGHVLIVDDDPNVRTVIAEALEEAGFEVSIADRGEEALAMLSRPGARFDAIVTDFAMPGITGGELLATVRRERPDLPGLVITGYAQAALAGEIPAGCKVLHKPFRAEELVSGVVELLQTRSRPAAIERMPVSVGTSR